MRVNFSDPFVSANQQPISDLSSEAVG